MSDHHTPDPRWAGQPHYDPARAAEAHSSGEHYAAGSGQSHAIDQQYAPGYGQPYTGDQQYNPGYGQQYDSGYGQPYDAGYSEYSSGYPQQSPGYPPWTPTSRDSPPLDQPHYGIGPVDGVKRGFLKYFRFDGRASRSEYWWFALGVVVGLTALSLVGGLAAALLGAPTGDGGRSVGLLSGLFFGLTGIVFLGSVIPHLALMVRRLHDGGYSGLLALLLLVPYLGAFALLIICALPSSPSGARFDLAPTGGYTPAGR